MIYALPLNEENGHNKLVLALFPTIEGFEYRVVAPKASDLSNPEARAADDALNLYKFNFVFCQNAGGKIPTVMDWKPNLNLSIANSFEFHIDLFPARLIPLDKKTDKQLLLNTALDVSRKQKVKR